MSDLQLQRSAAIVAIVATSGNGCGSGDSCGQEQRQCVVFVIAAHCSKITQAPTAKNPTKAACKDAWGAPTKAAWKMCCPTLCDDCKYAWHHASHMRFKVACKYARRPIAAANRANPSNRCPSAASSTPGLVAVSRCSKTPDHSQA